MKIKRTLKYALYRAMFAATGPGRGIRAILLYHSVGDTRRASIPRNAFEEQLRFLTNHFRVVRLCDLQDAMIGASADENLACVTFDDGHTDNYDIAMPILERLGIRATFLIAGGFIGGEFPTRFGRWPIMTAAQLRTCAGAGHEIGAHTINHIRLTDVPQATAWAEISGAKAQLEDLIGSPVRSFAYPKGTHNHAVRSAVKNAGYEIAVTSREGLVDNAPDWFVLPRMRVSTDITPAVFAARLSSVVTLYGRLRQNVAGSRID